MTDQRADGKGSGQPRQAADSRGPGTTTGKAAGVARPASVPSRPLVDATGQPLQPGDLLLNDQGRVWVVMPTDRLTAAQQVAVVREVKRQRGKWARSNAVGGTTYLRTRQAITIMPQTLRDTQKENASLYQTLHSLMVAPRLEAEAKARKQQVADHKAWIEEEHNA